MTSFTKIFILSLLLNTLYSLNAYAQLVPDFKVNDDSSIYHQFVGKVGTDSAGNFVIVWHDERNNRPNIYCQRFNSLGNRIGMNFIINDIPDSSVYPDIAVCPNGKFGIVWAQGNSTVFNQGKINFRLYNNNGTALTSTIQVSDSVGSSFQSPTIGADEKGNFIVIWNYSSKLSAENIYFQRLDSNGNKLGTNQNVSDSGISSRKSDPDITVRKDGTFIICWQDNRLNIGIYDIFMQMYDFNGLKIGRNVIVNEATNLSQEYPEITSDSAGNFFIAWSDFRFFPNILSLCQFYNNIGAKIGNNFLVNGNTVLYGFDSRDNGDLAAGIYDGSLPKVQRIRNDRSLWGNSFLISNEALSSTKYITDLKIHKDKIIDVWQDNRNGNIDIYCNIRSYTNPDSTTNIIQTSNEIPNDFKLLQNYPNPFNPITRIPFQINKLSYVKLKVFDILGRELKTLVNGKLQPGIYEAEFSSENLPSGIFYYRLESENYIESKSMIIVK